MANWQNPVYWEKLDRRKKNKERQKLKDLTDKDQEGHFELSSKNTFLRKESVVEKGKWGQNDSIAKGAICPQLSNNNSGKSNYQQWISYPKELPF